MHICFPFSDSSNVISEYGQTVITIASMMKYLGHAVTLVACNDTVWHDYSLKEFDVCRWKDAISKQFDLVIDIGGRIGPQMRKQLASSVVVFFYENVLFDEIQQFSYVRASVKRHVEKGTVDQIWIWEGQKIGALEIIFHCPVKCVPFIWSSAIFNNSIQDQIPVVEPGVFSIYEMNQDNTSCSAFPIVCLNSLHAEDISSCIVYDIDGSLKNNTFFRDNIERHLSFKDKIEYTHGIADLYRRSANGITIMHTRYRPIQMHMLQLAWIGLPFVHNSRVLSECGLVWNYYTDNSISECLRAVSVVSKMYREVGSVKKCNAHVREQLDSAWTFKAGASGWSDALDSINKKQETIMISFSDMWEGFDPTDNFFIDLLKQRGYLIGKSLSPNLHICGPFGNSWQKISRQIPIVFFSGEKWQRMSDEDRRISLFLTHDLEEDERHLRLPLWILFLDLWKNNTSTQRNPNGLPLRLAIESQGSDWLERKRFCAFVVSNPLNPVRNAAFQALNAYENVDSGGNYMNTIGSPIEHLYGGGGGGDRAKHAFLQDRKFCICYENSSSPGYVTEKLLHAKLAGCIPIYWGDNAAMQDFDRRGFINMCGSTNIVQVVDEIYSDEEQCKYMSQIPALGDAELKAMWSCIDKVGDALVGLIKHKELVVHVQQMDTLFVSFATKRFLSSIYHTLKSLANIPNIKYLLYIGADVEESDVTEMCTLFKWMSVRKLPVDITVEGFPDFWNPRHFGWKLWIYNEIVHEFKGQLLVFSDSGAQWIQPYPEMFKKALDTGICFVLDKNLNRHWCSDEMITQMAVSELELDSQQILGGIMAMRGGHKEACAFFKKCLEYGYNPKNLRGRKLIKVLPGGQPVGHRHDQSIMSVERIRSGLIFGTVTEDKATCMESLRRTCLTGTPIYLHRGNYITNAQAFPKVDDIWMVNLDRRQDRWNSFKAACPSLAEHTRRFSAIDGKVLQMTASIEALFAKNDFKWKKSVIGCALSHILLWAQLACEGPGVNSYLILEDDVRFTEKDELTNALDTLPDDAELAYFGGILPNNRKYYSQAIKSVNNIWSELIPNTFFTKIPTPYFHFCAYSYYLTKQGACKLLNKLVESNSGCFTSIDHYIGLLGLKKYVITESITGCFQDSDPSYVNSQFNDFDRIDTFDSDIWNNIDAFSGTYSTEVHIDSLYPIICDILRQIPSSIETCSLLNPAGYCKLLQLQDKNGEIETIRKYMISLQNPASVPFSSRTTILVSKCNTNNMKLCAISCQQVIEQNFEKACTMAKAYLIESTSITFEIAHIFKTGCLPIYIRQKGDDMFWNELHNKLSLVELTSPVIADKFIAILLADPVKGDTYHRGIMKKCAL